MGHHAAISAAIVARPSLIEETAEGKVRASEPVRVLGKLEAWRDQAENDYCALFMALPLTELQGAAATATGAAIGIEALTDFGTGLANLRDRAEWLAGLAEACARQIGAILTAQPGGDAAAMEVLAALQESNAADAQLIQACAEADRLDAESRDHDVASEAADATDPRLAATHRADAKRLADMYWVKIREIASLPASSRAGEVAKARILFDLVDTEADGTLSAKAHPADQIAFSLSADILRSAPTATA